jgi:lipopolysaccharide/colanic/teichoic acid biosynthesis glycosyltransferase
MSEMAGKVIGMSAGASRLGSRERRGSSVHELHTDVLSRERFLEQLHLEKRRADRSRAPLSVVIMRFAEGSPFDGSDLRDVLTDLSLNTRETDRVGHLADGVVAFLLPYSDAKAAEAFSKLVVDRIDGPPVSAECATYTNAGFDALLESALSGGEASSAAISQPTRKNRFGFAMKRALDIFGSSVLLLLCAPFMIAIAIAVKLSSPGPIIFRQTRIGRGGVPFSFYKFRSMRTDGDDKVHREYVAKLIAGKHQEINQGAADKPVYKLKADPRITRVGKMIRKTSIDELPQLINVLKGEMSLVGPRPPITYEAEKYQSWHMRRLQEVRPGMTGLWQVEGRSKTSFDDMVRLDLRYIRNWSFWLDIKILFKTVAVVIRCDGAD